jgi:hypothetical protein
VLKIHKEIETLQLIEKKPGKTADAALAGLCFFLLAQFPTAFAMG